MQPDRACRCRFALFVLVLSVSPSGIAAAQSSEAQEKIYHSVARGTVAVHTPFGSGTGVLVDEKERLLVTAHHVVDGQAAVKVLFPVFNDKGRIVPDADLYRPVRSKDEPNVALRAALLKRRAIDAKVVYADRWRDVAVLQIERLPAGARAVPLAKESARPGQNIHLIGCAGGSEGGMFGYCQGVVRNVFPRDLKGDALYGMRIVETQLATNKGDSGGPIVNDRGELVSIVSQGTIGAATPKGPFFAKQLIDHDVDVSEIHAALALRHALHHHRAGRLSKDAPADAALKSPAHVHELRVEPDYKYLIDMESREFDPYLRVEGTDGELARNDDRGDGLHARVVVAPQRRDTLRVIAAAFLHSPVAKSLFEKAVAGKRQAGYTLQVLRFARAPHPTVIAGKIVAGDRADPVLAGRRHKAHEVVFRSGHIYEIGLESKSFDPVLRLEGPDGTHLALNDDRKADVRDAQIEFLCGLPGTHRIIISSYEENAQGDYTLTVREYRPAGKN